MKILVVTRSAWDNTNSIGNTLSNIFEQFSSAEIANLYFRGDQPRNHVCNNYFRITDTEIIKSIIKPNTTVGKQFFWEPETAAQSDKTEQTQEKKLYNHFRQHRSYLALLLQEFFWRVGKWKSPQLDHFIKNFNPDIIFMPAFSTPYIHRILWYIGELSEAKIVLFHADDYLSTQSFGLSILGKRYINMRAKAVMTSAKKADINYCIVEKQADEYAEKIGKPMKIVRKSEDFTTIPPSKTPTENTPIRILYAGSTLNGRWKSIAMLARVIKKVNLSGKKFVLDIFSQYPLGDQASAAILQNGEAQFLGMIGAEQLKKEIENADILLHVEPFDRLEMLKNRLSFSTKIISYLHANRCVFAIGPEDSASIEFFIKNRAGVVLMNEAEIEAKLLEISDNRQILATYGEDAFRVGAKYFNKAESDQALYSDLEALLK